MKSNIVLIGLPMSGKTTIGKALAKRLNKKFVDLDIEIEKEVGMTIPDIFKNYGEYYFREIEKKVTKKFSQYENYVIAPGGGVIKNEENMMNLKEYGYVVFLNREVEKMIFSNNRPLTKSIDDLLKLKEERMPLYNKWKDVEVNNSSSIENCVNSIEEAYNESINN